MAELLSPAGNLDSMQCAFAYGADAVYAGQPRYSLRTRNNAFSHERLQQGIQAAHAQGKQFFVASNIIAQNNKIKTYLRDLQPVIDAKPDALIMADPGLIMLVRERWPELPIHLSVQSNVMNYAAVQFWQRAGIQRIILSRELSLTEIEEIRQQCPEMELETFVHGALCMAHSGRCLLSGYLNHRDPNQGACTNACRWSYKTHAAQRDEWGNVEPSRSSTNYVVEETSRRPGKYMAIEEDEHGTYIFNSKDLRAIQHVARLLTMGVDCLKIEGRTKSPFYVARTAQLYRRAIDDALSGKSFDFSLMDALDGLSARGYTEGFYRRHVPEAYQSYQNRTRYGVQQQVVGQIIGDVQDDMLEVQVKNQFQVGDDLELMTPAGNTLFQLTAIEDRQGKSLTRAPGGGWQVRIAVPSPVKVTNQPCFLIRHWVEDKVS